MSEVPLYGNKVKMGKVGTETSVTFGIAGQEREFSIDDLLVRIYHIF